MINGLHHVALAVNDLNAAVRDYEILLDQKADWRGEDGPTSQVWFKLANLSLALIAPRSTDPLSVQMRARFDSGGDGIRTLAFAVDDLSKAHRLVTQRAIEAEGVRVERFGPATASVTWLSQKATHGLRLGLVQTDQRSSNSTMSLDHIVIGTPDPERAIVLYGGRLGLDLRLDRSNPDWDARLLFFRCGDLIVEIAHRLSGGRGDGPDRFMGFSWRSKEPEKTRQLLSAAGFNVSELRKGRRPGTSVFTVRDRTCGVPTIFVGAEAQ
jgi:catechol 2,3-dioxygenase-like lactoylglutathione lyase family enzyme